MKKRISTNKKWEVMRYVTEVYNVVAPTKQEALDHVDQLDSNRFPDKRFLGRCTAKRTDIPGREKKP